MGNIAKDRLNLAYKRFMRSYEKPSILVIEDSLLQQDLYTAVLPHCRIYRTYNSQQAISYIDKAYGDIDAVIADSIGLTACIHIRQHYPTIPIVIISGKNDIQDYATKVKADFFKLKPVDNRDLVWIINTCLQLPIQTE